MIGRAAHTHGRGLRSRSGRGLLGEALEELGEVEREPEIAEAAAARVLGPLDGVLEVQRDRLHVLVELADDRLEPTLGPRADDPHRDDRGDERSPRRSPRL